MSGKELPRCSSFSCFAAATHDHLRLRQKESRFCKSVTISFRYPLPLNTRTTRLRLPLSELLTLGVPSTQVPPGWRWNDVSATDTYRTHRRDLPTPCAMRYRKLYDNAFHLISMCVMDITSN